MYRIIFKPSIAAWVVQLQTFGFFWSTVQDTKLVTSADRSYFRTQDRKFDNYDEALKYVYSVGLDQVYKDWAARPGWFTHPEQPTYQGGYQPATTPQPYIVNQPRVA